jgi:hypothetical protein
MSIAPSYLWGIVSALMPRNNSARHQDQHTATWLFPGESTIKERGGIWLI